MLLKILTKDWASLKLQVRSICQILKKFLKIAQCNPLRYVVYAEEVIVLLKIDIQLEIM